MATTSLLLCGHAEAAVQFSMSTQAQNLQVLEDALLSYRGFPAPPLRSSGTLEVVTPDGVLRADKVHGEAGPFVRARGIQYAAHPEGKLRWQPPVPRGPWSGVLDATAYGDDCIQGPFLNRLQEIGPARMSERCLFLNVWAPVVEHEHEVSAALFSLRARNRHLGFALLYSMRAVQTVGGSPAGVASRSAAISACKQAGA